VVPFAGTGLNNKAFSAQNWGCKGMKNADNKSNMPFFFKNGIRE